LPAERTAAVKQQASAALASSLAAMEEGQMAPATDATTGFQTVPTTGRLKVELVVPRVGDFRRNQAVTAVAKGEGLTDENRWAPEEKEATGARWVGVPAEGVRLAFPRQVPEPCAV